MKKWTLVLSVWLSIIFIGGFSKKALGAPVNSIDQLESAVNNAKGNETITLSESFPEVIDRTIKLKETANQIIIDGNGQTFKTELGKNVEIFSYGSGNGNATSTLTLQNMKLVGNGTSDRSKALSTNDYSGTFILDNVLIDSFNGGGHGGAIYLSADTIIKNSTISNNQQLDHGHSGGAIGTKDGFSKKVEITNTRLINNCTPDVHGASVCGEGGAIHFHQPTASAVIELTDNYFEGNSAAKDVDASNEKSLLADGGAISFWNIKKGVTIDLEGNTFANNIAGDDGGAILIQATETISSGISLKNNTFYGNKALGKDSGSNSGGAIQVFTTGFLRVSYVEYINNNFINNFATHDGGAIGNSGGAGGSSAGKFSNNLFVGNISNSSQLDDKGNNIAGSSSESKKDSNVGFADNKVKMKDVFGFETMNLSENYSTIMAGATVDGSAAVIPTIPIAPEKAADDKIDNFVTGIDSVLDQRNRPRPSETDINTNGLKSDIGAVEINWIKYDANGGTFEINNELTSYDGKIYYEGANPTEYYQVGYDKLSETVVDGKNTLSATPDDPESEFLGWSKYKNATEPDEGLEAGTTITIQKGNEILYAVYQKKAAADVTVRYIEINEDGDEVQELGKKILKGNIGEEYKAPFQEFGGYRLTEIRDSEGNITQTPVGKFTDEPQTIIFKYCKEQSSKGTVLVHHEDESGKPIAKSEVQTGESGAPYTTSAKSISGYTLRTTPANAKGSFTDGVIEVTYVYSKDPVGQGKVIVKYQDEAGNNLLPDGRESVELTGDINSVYAAELKEFEGYTIKTIPDNFSGLYTDKEQEVILVYRKGEAGQRNGVVLVHHVDEQGNPLVKSEATLGEIDEPYTTNPKTISGYEVVNQTPTNYRGTYRDGIITVTYVYKKTAIETGNVTYHYQDQAGNKLADPKIISGEVGASYPGANDSILRNFDGYYLTDIEGEYAGLFTVEDKKVTLIYAKQTVPTIKQGLVIAKYQDENGNEIDDTVFSLGDIGSDYTTEQKKIDDYTFKEVKGNPIGKYIDETITVTYVYTKNTEVGGGVTGTNNTGTTSRGSTLPVTSSGNNATTKNLPQTGESKRMATILTIIGVIVLAGVAFIVYRRREQTK